jgi:LAO/AO transport system kinase
MPPTLASRVLAGDPRAMARAISLIEDEDPAGIELVRAIFPRTGGAYLIGVTGPPGAGKSTLVDRLATELRKAGSSIGIVAVDPTSPFTGGAVLGDRLRMQAHASDEGVFIRSMATRGHLGGLARATGDAALVLDAAGKEVIIIETVGVGQDEVDIIRTADISIVTLVPGAGDDVQALKAGIMEIADIFVVNKADREGAPRLVSAVEGNLALQTYGAGDWRPPILKTVATTGQGVPELVASIAAFREHSRSTQAVRRRSRSEYRLRELVSHRFMEHLEREVLETGELGTVVDRIASRQLDPYAAADDLLQRAGLTIAATRPPRPMQTVLDHIGIAVADPEAALAFYRDALGLDIEAPEHIPAQQVRAYFVPVGEARLELLESTGPESPVAKYVDKRGPGVHHITLRVGDLQAALERLKARGVRLVTETPQPGAEGSLIAFIHPKSTGGVLIELKQSGIR